LTTYSSDRGTARGSRCKRVRQKPAGRERGREKKEREREGGREREYVTDDAGANTHTPTVKYEHFRSRVRCAKTTQRRKRNKGREGQAERH